MRLVNLDRSSYKYEPYDDIYIGRKAFICWPSVQCRIWDRRQPKFMHHPVCFDSFGSSSSVEDERFLQADAFGSFRGVYRSISSSGLPKPGSCDSVWPCAVPIFPVSWAVEVPFLLPSCRQLFLRKRDRKYISKLRLSQRRKEAAD